MLALFLCGLLLAPQQAAEPTREELLQEINRQHHVLADWAGLTRYGSEDTEVKPPAAGEQRVVFIGDDITEHWTPFFPGKPYFNRGISHQISPQLLVRFRQDVISLQPKVVVIQAGANDFAGLSGGGTEGTIEENVMSMVELAKANGIKVVLASTTPVCNCYGKQTARRPPGKLAGLNRWLRQYAEQSGAVFVNYYTALAAGREMKKEFTDDGFLPNAQGYAAMAPLMEEGIAKALAK